MVRRALNGPFRWFPALAVFAVTLQAANGGLACPTNSPETQVCNVVDCEPEAACVGSWGDWGACSVAQCGQYGVRSREYIGGAACPSDSQTVECTPACVACVGSWGGYTACSAPCGSGAQQRSYTVTTEAVGGGAACPNDSPQTHVCNTEPCISPGELPAASGVVLASGGDFPPPPRAFEFEI